MLLSDISIHKLKGVGEKTALEMQKCGINTVLDLLYHFPRKYEDRTPRHSLEGLYEGMTVALIMTVTSTPTVARTGKGLNIVRANCTLDSLETLPVMFFNQPYMANNLHLDEKYRFYGKLMKKGNKFYLSSPKVEKANAVLETVVPVYPPISNIPQGKILKFLDTALGMLTSTTVTDRLDRDLRIKYDLVPLNLALLNIHKPTDKNCLEFARKRLIFDELFEFSLSALRLKEREDVISVPSFDKVDMSGFYSRIPYKPTNAQSRAILEIENDLTGGGKKKTKAMRRLLEGDVGSGKTLVAEAAAYMTVKNGGKCAVMAPTEILAAQHYEAMKPLFNALGYEVLLLTSSTKTKERRIIADYLTDEAPLIIIGTHALFEEKTEIRDLRLVITDEQHRFGVKQRERLLSKATTPNSLSMSATPIPRTLAMFLFAGLDISILDELPPGRKPVKTRLISSDVKSRLYGFLTDEISQRKQVYVVCPLIEEGEEETDLMSAEECLGRMKKAMPSARIALIHGKMKADEKNGIMTSFSNGEIDVLISTTVIEVGVNVPSATVMVIENAERFGLAALHQLRGRVGRGRDESWCFLVSDVKGGDAKSRLDFLCHNNDGFKVAEFDLETRGPGEFFGSRQHGDIPMSIADASRDIKLLKCTMDEAEIYLKREKEIK